MSDFCELAGEISLNGVRYVSVVGARQYIEDHGCNLCPFVGQHRRSSSCPYFMRAPWAPEMHCGRGHWVPLETYLKWRITGG